MFNFIRVAARELMISDWFFNRASLVSSQIIILKLEIFHDNSHLLSLIELEWFVSLIFSSTLLTQKTVWSLMSIRSRSEMINTLSITTSTKFLHLSCSLSASRDIELSDAVSRRIFRMIWMNVSHEYSVLFSRFVFTRLKSSIDDDEEDNSFAMLIEVENIIK